MMQTGLFGFRVDALEWFADASRTPLELIESVDMVRVLQHGRKVRMVPMSKALVGVDTPDDLDSARLLMAADSRFTSYKDARSL